NKQTILELITTDRSGLLSQVGRVFNKHDINLHSARITTIGSRVEDMFYITDMQSQPILDSSKQEKLREELIYVLDNTKPKKASNT
ncbi:MAG: ACT domain-containing protein, partial [Methyloglobulus sp.]|nr:ACT domain-containing protein [Methyloglobulus sp.]